MTDDGPLEISTNTVLASRLTKAGWQMQFTGLSPRPHVDVPPEFVADYRGARARLRLELFRSRSLLIYSVGRHGLNNPYSFFFFYEGEVNRMLDVITGHQDEVDVDHVYDFIVELVVLSERAFFEFSDETLLPLEAEPL